MMVELGLSRRQGAQAVLSPVVVQDQAWGDHPKAPLLPQCWGHGARSHIPCPAGGIPAQSRLGSRVCERGGMTQLPEFAD